MMRLQFLNWVVRVWLCDEVGYLCPDCRRNKMIAHRQALHVLRGGPDQKRDDPWEMIPGDIIEMNRTYADEVEPSSFDYPQWADNRDPDDMPDQIGPWTR